MLRRRLPLVLTLLCAGMVVVLYLAMTSPRVYESTAIIQIDAPAFVNPDEGAGVTVARRVQLIEQRLTVRENLLAVIERHNLFAGAPLSPAEKAILLRKSTRIDSIAATGQAGGGPPQLAAIIITTEWSSPGMAADIANDFADSVVNGDRQSREARLDQAYNFLSSEEAQLESSMASHDQEIAEFSREHRDSLPGAFERLQAELTQLLTQETAVDRDLRLLERERIGMQAADSSPEGRATASLVQQMRSAEVELAQARRLLSPDHPEVKRLEENIARLAKGGISESSRAALEQMELIDTQLSQLREQKSQIATRRHEVDLARAKTTEVVQDYEALIREQQRMRDRYADISRRLADIETQKSLQENDLNERFVILERALPPDYPAISGRKKKAVVGAFFSVLAAIGVAFVMEIINPVLRNGRQFARVTGALPVIDLIHLPSEAEKRRVVRRRIYLLGVVIVFLFLAFWIIGWIPGLPSPAVVAS